MIELLPYAEQLVELGFTPMSIIALGVAWKINKAFTTFDKRLAILESKAAN